jgi:hypothetical protein
MRAFKMVQLGHFNALCEETAGEDSQEHPGQRPYPVNPPVLPLPRDDRRAFFILLYFESSLD